MHRDTLCVTVRGLILYVWVVSQSITTCLYLSDKKFTSVEDVMDTSLSRHPISTRTPERRDVFFTAPSSTVSLTRSRRHTQHPYERHSVTLNGWLRCDQVG